MFEIDIDWTEEIYQHLNIALKNLDDLSPQLKQVQTFIESIIQGHITDSKNANGKIYTKLSDNTIRELKRKGINRTKPLDTENYRSSFQTIIDKNTIFVVSIHPGSNTHEKGLEVNIFGRGVMFKFPKRSAVYISNKQMMIIANDYLKVNDIF